MKALVSVWATFDSFFLQDHVPGIMLREFKEVMHVLWNDHYQLRHTKDTYKEFYIMD